jgi:hypothetical protein
LERDDVALKNPMPALKSSASNCVGQQLLHTRHGHRLQLRRRRRKKKKEEDPHDIVHYSFSQFSLQKFSDL